MTCRLLSLSSEAMWPELLRLLENRDNPDQTVETDVRAMLDAVRKGGDSAVLEYVRRFDCPDMRPPLRVPAEDLEQAARDIPAESLDCIKQAADNIRAFHEAQKDRSWFLTRDDGTILGQKIEAVDRAGLYVPGGRGGNTPLISSLLMTAIPAQAAGVREIAVVTPPRADGTLNPHILAAAHLLGVHEIYCMGGAWAIAALAYGTETVAPVDVIAGPGNIWVTTAKRLVQGRVGIDMIAGPSEVLVLADDSANPEWLAADMLSQAEHDALASAICITDNEALAHAVIAELERQSATLPRADIVRKSLADWSAVVLVRQPRGPGAPRSADARAVVRAAPYPSCGRGLPRPLRAGAPRRLLRRAQPCAAHARHGPFLLGPFRTDLLQTHQHHRRQPRLRRRQCGRRGPARPHGAARSPCPLDGMPEAIIPSTFNPRQRSKDVT